MLIAVCYPKHIFTGQDQSSKRLTSIVRILTPETVYMFSYQTECWYLAWPLGIQWFAASFTPANSPMEEFKKQQVRCVTLLLHFSLLSIIVFVISPSWCSDVNQFWRLASPLHLFVAIFFINISALIMIVFPLQIVYKPIFVMKILRRFSLEMAVFHFFFFFFFFFFWFSSGNSLYYYAS